MKVLRIVGALIVLVLTVFAAVLVAARWHDGPLGMVAGGALASGEWNADPAPDLRFAHDLPTIEFQLLSPVRSRTTWVIEHEGRLFIPSGYMNGVLGKIWKHWPHEAEQDGRVVVRIAGKRYVRTLVRYRGGPESGAVLAELNRKYGMAATQASLDSGDLWLFELQPRVPDPGELTSAPNRVPAGPFAG